MPTLAEKLLRWRELELERLALEKEIEAEVIPLGQSQAVENVVAEYRASDKNGSWNYEAICQSLEPSPELVEAHTVHPEPYIDFKALAEAAGMGKIPPEMKDDPRFYKAPVGGKPKVTVKLKK